MFRYFFIALFYSWFLFSTSSAAGVPNYLPDNPHPRIWLTPTIKSDLEAKVSSNTPEWQALKGWCDANLGTNLPEGYQGLDWQRYLMQYALCYQMTGIDAYGNQGVVYLKALLNDNVKSGPVGSGGGGATSIQVDSGYVARSIGAGAALGRDWLDGAPDLDPATIALVNQRLGEWITWYNASGFSRDNATDNYYAGYFAMVYLAGISLYGDDGYDPAWLTQAKTMWSTDVLPLLNSDLNGGEWLEGWNYGPWSVREYVQYPFALETAAGDARAWSETDWHEDLVKGSIHTLHPARNLMSDDGSWSGDASRKGWPTLQTTAAFLASSAPLSPELKGLARWYENNLVRKQGNMSLWEAFLWADPTGTQVVPTADNVGLSHVMGLGHALTRSGWDDPNATFVDMIGRKQENYNPGEIKIASRGVPLLVDADTYQLEGNLANVPLITGGHTYAPNPEPWHNEVASSFEEGGAYFYRKVTRLEKAYDGTDWNTPNPSASHYDRQTLFLRPDLIVNYDNITVANPSINKVTLQWNFVGESVVNDNKIIATNGAGKIFVTTLGHSVVQNKSLTTAGRIGVHNVKVGVSDSPLSNQLITIFETDNSSSTSSAKTTIVNTVSGNMKGVYISSLVDGKKNLIAFFTADQGGNEVDSDVAFNLTGDGQNSPYIFLANMPPNTKYTFVPPFNKNQVPQTYKFVKGIMPGQEARVITTSSEGTLFIAPPQTVNLK